MFIKELWRYPVKSLAGERVKRIEVGPHGMTGDRTVLVTRNGRVITSRTHHRLLRLKGTLNEQGTPLMLRTSFLPLEQRRTTGGYGNQ